MHGKRRVAVGCNCHSCLSSKSIPVILWQSLRRSCQPILDARPVDAVDRNRLDHTSDVWSISTGWFVPPPDHCSTAVPGQTVWTPEEQPCSWSFESNPLRRLGHFSFSLHGSFQASAFSKTNMVFNRASFHVKRHTKRKRRRIQLFFRQYRCWNWGYWYSWMKWFHLISNKVTTNSYVGLFDDDMNKSLLQSMCRAVPQRKELWFGGSLIC